MATSVEAVGIAQMLRFRDRVNFFVIKAAAAVMAEVNTTQSHAERVIFGVKVFSSDYNINQYVAAVLTNSTVLAGLSDTADNNGVSDNDLEFTVNSFYNAFSGAST